MQLWRAASARNLGRLLAIGALALTAMLPTARSSGHPDYVECGPNIGGNAINFYVETWCGGYISGMYTSAWLWKYNGTQYNLMNSSSDFCISPSLPDLHVCAFNHAGGGNGNGSGYYAVEGAHNMTHGIANLVRASYIEFYVN